MQMRAVVSALLLAMTMLTACDFVVVAPPPTPVPPPAPTRDVPRFATGEATAVVKTWLGRLSVPSTPPRSCLSYYDLNKSVWAEDYLGNGVWRVTASYSFRDSSSGNFVDKRGEWRVYENSLAVDSVQKTIGVLC